MKALEESDLPDPQELAEQYDWATRYWSARDDFIREIRDALAGRNLITAPEKMAAKAKSIHMHLLASILNEKTSRYLNIPVAQVIVEDPIDSKSRSASSDLERAIACATYEMERRGDGDCWSRVVADAVLLDGGCELIERAPAAFWPEIHQADTSKTGKYPLQSKQRQSYKQEMGPPVRSLYVPLEHTYPIYEGPTPVRVFHNDVKSLWSIKQNTLLKHSIFENIATDGTGGLSTFVPIVRYADGTKYAYYALVGNIQVLNDHEQRRLLLQNMGGSAEFIFLYGYEHNLGRVNYNFVGGRYGGWKTDENAIESVGKAMMELSQGADEVFSQVFTNIRSRYWGSMKYMVDPEKRGYSSGTMPEVPDLSEGENIPLYVGEDLLPLYQTQNDPAVPWFIDQIKEQLGKLGGSGVLFGQRQPGVDTGYQNAQQISQAEHLDEKLEQHISVGAVDRTTIMLLHFREMEEDVWVHHAEKKGKKVRGKYLKISPDDLSPLPRIDVQVRKPRPIDALTNLRAAREATDDRGGKGPLYSDDSAREVFLAMEYPDLEDRKIQVQGLKQAMLKTGIVTNKIGELVNIKLAQTGVPEVSPEMVGKADPALLAAIQQIAGGMTPPPGGVDPRLLAQQGGQGGPPAPMNPLNRSGGMLSGDAGVEARIGEMAAQEAANRV